ncbi:patatin-like phospholipase family protein [Xanthomonas arboricola]|uniref:patatin-like phospholipase family protein n=1 Tax=Xanthomonas arboricola TaxID=56448 RepID=UPI0009BA02B7|nr:patatin-like phospholipase family protein [Xanthomonas arboricola]
MSKRVFLVFQGGGAKGIAHIGGLAAWEETQNKADALPESDGGLELAGVAGTSAGAIIASLVAAGYSSKQIFDDGPAPRHLLERVKGGLYKKPSSLFGLFGWRLIKLLRDTSYSADRRPRLAKFSISLLPLALLAWWVWPAPSLSWVLKIIFLFFIFLLFVFMPRGLASLKRVRDVVDEAIATGPLKGKVPSKNVTFANLQMAKGSFPLKLVATNLTKRTVELFSYEESPDTVIADAVCASICLPIIFPPFKLALIKGGVKQPESEFLDGGLLSNLPLWPFDEEREIWTNTQTIGFSLQPLEAEVAKRKSVYLSLIDAVVSGPSRIHARSIPGLIMVKLPIKFDMLSFDESFEDYKSAIHEAKTFTLDVLQREFGISVIGEMLDDLKFNIIKYLVSVLDDVSVEEDASLAESDLDLRLSLVISRPGYKKIVYPRFEVGHSGQAKDERKLPVLYDSGFGELVSSQKPAVSKPLGTNGGGSNGRETLLLDDSLWMMMFPLLNGEQQPDLNNASSAVLTVDSATLTATRFASILDVVEEAGLLGLLDLLSEVVNSFDEARSLGQLATRIQSWD